jgi:glucose-6-phosphate 1-dehydrogenase
VIFGANGDLNKRKLIPALCNLASIGLLPETFAVIGVVREETSDAAFRESIGKAITDKATHKVDGESWKWLEKRLYVSWGDLKDPATYARLKSKVDTVGAAHGTGGNAMFYLSTPPSIFAEVVTRLGEAGLAREEEGRWRRVIVEKPFGHDLDSAKALNQELLKTLSERQIYRIDHYLGKETVQNILVFRFANGLFEPIWNHNYIDHVQISTSETVGVEGRGGYYEEAGALRDMVPNHLLQLLALIAMEPPASFEAEAVRDEKAKVMRSISALSPEDVLTRTVRGQYGEGAVAGKDGAKEKVIGYRQEPKVSRTSATETFVAMKLLIDNWRWAKTPFYIRTGKRLAKRVTEIVIQFKRAPFTPFREHGIGRMSPNLLVLHIQPKEGISMRFGAKVPGPGVKIGDVDMEFKYADFFGAKPSTGYETLLYDCFVGDATLFQRADTVESGWSVVAPMLEVWRALQPRTFPNYAAGSWGPREADELLERDGRAWRRAE